MQRSALIPNRTRLSKRSRAHLQPVWAPMSLELNLWTRGRNSLLRLPVWARSCHSSWTFEPGSREKASYDSLTALNLWVERCLHSCENCSSAGTVTRRLVIPLRMNNLKFSALSFAKPVLPSWMHMFLFSYVGHRSNDARPLVGGVTFAAPPLPSNMPVDSAVQHLMVSVLWYSVKKRKSVLL